MADEQQSNIRQENNAAVSGLNMDQTLNQVKKGQLTYALNAAVENFDANGVNYQNEPANELCVNFPDGFILIGTHFINEKNKHIFFLIHPETGESEIGYMDNNDCIYKTYINAPCLNFNINHPIHKSVHKITNCTTEIYWTDGLNPRRYLDIDNLSSVKKIRPGTDVCDNETIDEIDCNKLNVQPDFAIPSLNVREVTNIGNLIAGTYQFAIQYCDVSGNGYTSYYSVTNPTPIANPDIVTPDLNYPVGRAIILDINDIDITGYFQYFNLAVIKTINNETSVQLVGTYFIDDSTRSITYTGQNQTQINLTLNDIFERFPYYEIAQDLTAVQDVLVWDNLTSIDRINYQKIANQIDLNWQTYKLPADEDYSDELNATNLRGYMRDEVYAFEIVFLLKNGKQTDGFHIPGRAKNSNEFTKPDVPDTNPDFIGTPDYTSGGVGFAPYWKIYNTASVTGAASGPNINSATPHEYGEFAYWESTDLYPCNDDVWGELANTPIRHHKFPDVKVSPIFESGSYTIAPNISVVMQDRSVFPIGVKIDVSQVLSLIGTSDLTSQEKNNIAGFKIVRGDRSTNKSVIAKGILRNVGKYEREGTEYFFPNYPYNDLREDPFLLEKNNAFNLECLTFRFICGTTGLYEYTDCFTGETASAQMLTGVTYEVCSITKPTALEGTFSSAPIPVKYDTYYVSCDGIIATFSYTDINGTVQSFTLGTRQNRTLQVQLGTVPSVGFHIGGYTIRQLSDGTVGGNNFCLPPQLNAFKDDDYKYRNVFNSPDTSFGSPFLGDILKIENVVFGAGRGHHVQVREHALYKLLSYEAQDDALISSEDVSGGDPTAMFTAYQAYLTTFINGITRRNYAYSYNSIASYDYYANVDNDLGIKQRPLDIVQYLFPGVQNVRDTHDINNFSRESSVYLRTDLNKTFLPAPSQTPNLIFGTSPIISDESRYTLSDRSLCSTPEQLSDIKTVSYYASIKSIFPNQWGQMYSYQTIDTGYQVNLNNTSSTTIFGGDTFINKFAFKTKLPFFIDDRVGAPDDSDVFYDEIGNIAYPKYWFSSRSILYDFNPTTVGLNELRNIISIKAHNFDCPNSQFPPSTASEPNPGRTFYDGKMYLYAYGIPYFYCESTVNVDLRQAFNNREGDFWPRVSSGVPDDWLQQSNVPIALDNTYYYNVGFSKQNEETFFSHLPVDWVEQLCYTNFPFRAIYSDRQQSFSDNRINSWLIYRPISFFDFPQNYGKLTSLDGIQNRAILARFENKSLLYNTLLTVETSNPQAAYLGNDSLFRSSPPVDFAETDLGYVGSQHKMLLKIPQGQVTIDAKRGQIFLISGTAIEELTGFGSGVNRFMTDHLAFEILRYFPDVNVDNHFNGVGLHGVFDSKYDRIIITKLDYIPLSKDIKYDASSEEFYIQNGSLRKIVNLTDLDYFCNKSWTISFNFNTKSWVSFHSYIPNWYIGENNFFYSGINESCDIDLVVAKQPPITSTSTTTIYTPNCLLGGQARAAICSLGGSAIYVPSTTTSTTSSTSSSSTSSTSTSSTSSTSTSSTSSSTTSTTTTLALPCECHIGTIASTGTYSYYECDGTFVTGSGSLGNVICFDVNKPHTRISDEGPTEICSCYTPSTTTSTSSSTSSTSTSSTSSTSTSSTSTSTTSSTSTSTSTSSSTTSTTTTVLDCNCFTFVNTTASPISISLRYCGDSFYTAYDIGAGEVYNACLNATSPYIFVAGVNVYNCGVSCTSSGTCTSCLPTTTTTTSSSTSSSTSTSSTSTTLNPGCVCYKLENPGGGSEFLYVPCGSIDYVAYLFNETEIAYVCSNSSYPPIPGSNITVSSCGTNCNDNNNCTGCIPTTSTTTTIP